MSDWKNQLTMPEAPDRFAEAIRAGGGAICRYEARRRRILRYGAAAATGLGEEIMRGCLSYEIVSLMKRGRTPEEACREALRSLTERVEGSGGVGGAVSVIALSRDGAFGAATTLPCFPFAAGRDGEPLLYAAGSAFTVRRAQEEELLGID